MSECTRLSDRMPEVVHGRSRWTPDEAAHLAACADCRDELALVQATVALGRRAPRIADSTALTAMIERRLTGGCPLVVLHGFPSCQPREEG